MLVLSPVWLLGQLFVGPNLTAPSSLATPGAPEWQQSEEQSKGRDDSGERSRLPTGLAANQQNVQWLTKLHYVGSRGDFVMSLIVRLEKQDLFSIQAKDRLGRTWWDLAVNGARALSLERRSQTYCSYDGPVEIAAIPLGPLEFSVLPQLLLGRLPFLPVASSKRSDGGWSLEDARGRSWLGRTEERRLVSWTLMDAGRPAVWWSGSAKRGVLSARAEGLQLRWKNGSLRPLAQPPKSISIPAGYRRDCGPDWAGPP